MMKRFVINLTIIIICFFALPLFALSEMIDNDEKQVQDSSDVEQETEVSNLDQLLDTLGDSELLGTTKGVKKKIVLSEEMQEVLEEFHGLKKRKQFDKAYEIIKKLDHEIFDEINSEIKENRELRGFISVN